jgi:hypothetical protein
MHKHPKSNRKHPITITHHQFGNADKRRNRKTTDANKRGNADKNIGKSDGENKNDDKKGK